jgi:hypothetical protein
MLTIATFLWRRPEQGYQLPAVVDYKADHVHRMRSMLARHLHVPHRFVCITDQPIEGIETLPLWDDGLGGCYRRLKVYDPEFTALGDRFAIIDLDAVIVADVTPLVTRTEPLVLNAYNGINPGKDPDQYYNGALQLMSRGAHPEIWREFDPETTPGRVQAARNCIGSDQAWLRVRLGKSIPRFTNADGVYEYRQFKTLPSNARLVFFSGRRDPSMEGGWVPTHWR